MNMIRRLLSISMVVIPASSQQQQAKPKQSQVPIPITTIQQIMTQAEFQNAGLQKLTSEELIFLNRWFETFAIKLYRNSTSSSTTTSVIESYIEGNFQGWDGETTFKLDNGQIWQQDSYSYTYHYAYHPKVLIYRSGGSYIMKVDGVEKSISVKRLK